MWLQIYKQLVLPKRCLFFKFEITTFRLEKLQRLAEKIHHEAKITDSKLDDIEAWIEDEAKRVDHLHPKDAKNNCDQVSRQTFQHFDRNSVD